MKGDEAGWWEWAKFCRNEGLYLASADEDLGYREGAGNTPKKYPFAKQTNHLIIAREGPQSSLYS